MNHWKMLSVSPFILSSKHFNTVRSLASVAFGEGMTGKGATGGLPAAGKVVLGWKDWGQGCVQFVKTP